MKFIGLSTHTLLALASGVNVLELVLEAVCPNKIICSIIAQNVSVVHLDSKLNNWLLPVELSYPD